MTETRRSLPRLASTSILAIGLAASPIAIDIAPTGLGNNAAFAQAAAPKGMEMQQGPESQSGMTQPAQARMVDRETIRSVQRKLNQLGYQAGPEDGIMGPRTRKAISAYQARAGMARNGTLTPDLANRIMAESKSG